MAGQVPQRGSNAGLHAVPERRQGKCLYRPITAIEMWGTSLPQVQGQDVAMKARICEKPFGCIQAIA